MNWLSDPSSVQGVAMRTDWYALIIAGTVVGAYVYGAIAWCLFAYRARAGRAADDFEGNPPLEVLYVALPLLIVFGLFLVTLAIEGPIDRVDARPAYRVEVTAFRWSWRFAYAGGRIVSSGTPDRPPTLYLPLERTTQVALRSADVTHSFWIPAFLFKRDAIPGLTNTFDLTPTRAGSFPARCAQFCGLEHAHMTFVVDVMPVRDFDRLLAAGTIRP